MLPNLGATTLLAKGVLLDTLIVGPSTHAIEFIDDGGRPLRDVFETLSLSPGRRCPGGISSGMGGIT